MPIIYIYIHLKKYCVECGYVEDIDGVRSQKVTKNENDISKIDLANSFVEDNKDNNSELYYSSLLSNQKNIFDVNKKLPSFDPQIEEVIDKVNFYKLV